jgi:hypothetical protein
MIDFKRVERDMQMSLRNLHEFDCAGNRSHFSSSRSKKAVHRETFELCLPEVAAFLLCGGLLQNQLGIRFVPL